MARKNIKKQKLPSRLLFSLLTAAIYTGLLQLPPVKNAAFNLSRLALYYGISFEYYAVGAISAILCGLLFAFCSIVPALIVKARVRFFLAWFIYVLLQVVFLVYDLSFDLLSSPLLVAVVAFLAAMVCASRNGPRRKKGEEDTIYGKDKPYEKGSAMDKFLYKSRVTLIIGGILCIFGSAFLEETWVFVIGWLLLIRGVMACFQKKKEAAIESKDYIVTPKNWPEDCHLDYSQGLIPQGTKKQMSSDKEALHFYDVCVSQTVSSLDSMRDIQKAILIGENLGLKDCSEANVRRIFEAGRQASEYNRLASSVNANAEIIREKRKEELDTLKEAMRYYGLHGLEKRMTMLKDMVAQGKKDLSSAKFRAQSVNHTLLQKEHDWATHGGIASGIAGPAAGVATAIDIQNKNAAIRAQNAKMAPAAALLTSKYLQEAKAIEKAVEGYEKTLESCKYKLVSPDDMHTVFSFLKIKKNRCSVSATGAVTVSAEFSVDPSYRIFETAKPSIDGCVAARLLQDETVVGSGYFVFPVEGIEKVTELSSICTKTVDPNAHYTLRFEPVDLWAMETLS